MSRRHRWNLVVLISLLYFDNTIAEEAKLSRSYNHHRCYRRLRHDERINQHRQSPTIKHMKRRRTKYSNSAHDDFLSLESDGSLANNNGQNYRKHQDAIIISSPRKMIRALAFLSGCNNHLCSNNHRRTSQSAAAAAFVSNLPYIKLKQLSSQQSQLSTTPLPPISKTSTTISTTTTSLHLKFKTFEEMINHHHSTPLLIDFYSPFCGPCKLMKGEIMSIRDELDSLGPTLAAMGNDGKEVEEEEEDCSVEDYVITLSNDCLEDGYLEERQDGVAKDDDDANVANDDDDDGGKGALSSLVKEDTTLLLNDLLPPTPPPLPPTISTTSSSEEQQQQHIQSTKQHTTTITTNTPSGIPVYHVNTNKFPQVGTKNHIAGLPTLVLFYRGEELWRNEGLMKGEEILNVLIELQEGGWKKKMMIKEKSGGDDRKEDAVLIHGEEVDKMTKTKKKKRKGRRLGG